MDDSARGRHDIILEQYLLTDLKFFDNVIYADDGPFKGSTTPMVDLGTYEFKDLNTGKITSK